MLSSNPKDLIYIETKNLDGETNLKSKTARELKEIYKNEKTCIDFQGNVMYDSPTPNLYAF